MSESEMIQQIGAEANDVNKDCYVYTYHKNLHRYFVFNSLQSLYDRSLRRLRRKVRYNYYERIFKPNMFVTLTIDPEHFEAKDKKINVSAHIRKVFNVFNNVKHYSPSRVWKLELGTKKTKRPHIHILINFKNEEDLQYLLQIWEWGKISDFKVIDPESIDCVFNYITKYMSKNTKELVKIPDPKMFGKQRFGTSRDLIKPPKSLYTQARESDARKCNQCIDENIDIIQKEIDELMVLCLDKDDKTVRGFLNDVYEKKRFFMIEKYWFKTHEEHVMYYERMKRLKYQVVFPHFVKWYELEYDYKGVKRLDKVHFDKIKMHAMLVVG